MKLITKETDYAMRALSCMAHNLQRVNVAELAQQLDVPRPFLRKILQALNKKGVLKSHKGSGGGFTLNFDPNKYSIFDLMEALQGPFQLNDHLFKGKLCPNVDRCQLMEKINLIEQHIIQELKNVTIASLI